MKSKQFIIPFTEMDRNRSDFEAVEVAILVDLKREMSRANSFHPTI